MYIDIEELKGKTLIDIKVYKEEQEIWFTCSDGTKYRMHHRQDCCESVHIEDIVGDLSDLIGSPLLMAEKVCSEENPLYESDESHTWTFYKFATIKGYVTIRWYGSSNGYYSESVDFEMV